MRYNIYTVFDSKAKMHLQPFFCRSTPEAMRSIQQLVNEKDHAFNLFAEDYTLLHIGHYDEETANIEGYKASIALCGLRELRFSPEKEAELLARMNGQDDDLYETSP